jgi:hypothetical protein
MKKRLLILLIAIIPAAAFTVHTVKIFSEKEAVEDLIMKSYVHGAFNELNPDAMLNGFHPDFAIFSADGESLARYEIKTWADGVSKRKSDPKFDPAKNVWEHNFASVDVTGNVAAVKIELSKGGKHIYTDYLSLIKFDSGWKIVGKVYNKHE